MASLLSSASIIVLKIGSSLLVDEATGLPRAAWLASVAADCMRLLQRGQRLIIVTSGAVALGKKRWTRPLPASIPLEVRQALAALGQVPLINVYDAAFQPSGLSVAQVLLTPDDTEERSRHLNARRTLQTLLGMSIIPVINENDTVATAELRFGDNDRLAARVAQMIGAELLILFSDIDGLYDANPKQNINAKHIQDVKAITPTIMAMAGASGSSVGTGGMVTKLAAATIATNAGCAMIIMDGHEASPLSRLEAGARHTLFHASATPLSSRKRWIVSMLNTAASVTIDDGAVKALYEGRSLLPIGIRRLDGPFARGDVVLIKNTAGAIVGRGMAAYHHEDAERIKGKHSRELPAILGFAGREEFIHRDDMVLEATDDND